MDLMTRQLELEDEMRTTGIARYQTNTRRAVETERNTARPPVKRLLNEAHTQIVAAIEMFMVEARSGKAGVATAPSKPSSGLETTTSSPTSPSASCSTASARSPRSPRRQAPRNVWQSYHRGIYPIATPSEAADLFDGLRVRLGAYGDPAAVPFDVWSVVLARCDAMTGYTHQWRACDARFARYVMASCDNAADYQDAKALGYRTFRVRAAGETLNAREVICPASKEAGVKTNCAACVACGGHGAKAKADIAIFAHGAVSKVNAFTSRIAA